MADTSKDARDLYLDSVFGERGVASMTHEKLKALLAERDDFAALERDQAACVAAQDTEIAKLKASLRAYVALDRKHVTEIEHLESRVAALESAARVVCSEFYQQHPLIKALAAALDAAAPAPQSDDTEENMRRLGHAVMDRIAAHTKDAGGPLEDWTPAECPSEVIDDLIDMIESLRACNAAPAVSQAAADVLADAERYRWLRTRDLDTIHKGGVFAGMTPDNVVLNGEDLDNAIDAARLDRAAQADARALTDAERAEAVKEFGSPMGRVYEPYPGAFDGILGDDEREG